MDFRLTKSIPIKANGTTEKNNSILNTHFEDSKKQNTTEDDSQIKENEKTNEKIQKSVEGFLKKKNLRPFLAEKLTKIIQTNNPNEISEAKSDLESEGLNSDEATELIQKIFSEIHSPKYRNSKFGKKCRENNNNSGIRKTWNEALANMNQIMQVIHTNNYQFHQYCRKNKVYSAQWE